MRLTLACLVVLAIGFTESPRGIGAPLTPNRELVTILGNLAGSAANEQYRQIEDAVNASPQLVEQLNELAASGKLTAIVVLNSTAAATAPNPGPFSAWIAGTSLVFTEKLLPQLTQRRLYDVVHPDDILPNNTTFVLGHLAFHLRVAPPPINKLAVDDYVAGMLNQEAHAFIQAWNDALDAATQQNHGPLTAGQIGSLLLNMRYRFAFVTADIHLGQGGTIDPNESNVNAIATALKKASVTDIQ